MILSGISNCITITFDETAPPSTSTHLPPDIHRSTHIRTLPYYSKIAILPPKIGTLEHSKRDWNFMYDPKIPIGHKVK